MNCQRGGAGVGYCSVLSARNLSKGARLEDALRRYNGAHDTPLSIALGYDCFCKGETITKLISRADSIMYEDKHRQKEEQKDESR